MEMKIRNSFTDELRRGRRENSQEKACTSRLKSNSRGFRVKEHSRPDDGLQYTRKRMTLSAWSPQDSDTQYFVHFARTLASVRLCINAIINSHKHKHREQAKAKEGTVSPPWKPPSIQRDEGAYMVTQLSHVQMSGFRPRDRLTVRKPILRVPSFVAFLPLCLPSGSGSLVRRVRFPSSVFPVLVFLVRSPMHINYPDPRLSFWIIRNLIHTTVHIHTHTCDYTYASLPNSQTYKLRRLLHCSLVRPQLEHASVIWFLDKLVSLTIDESFRGYAGQPRQSDFCANIFKNIIKKKKIQKLASIELFHALNIAKSVVFRIFYIFFRVD